MFCLCSRAAFMFSVTFAPTQSCAYRCVCVRSPGARGSVKYKCCVRKWKVSICQSGWTQWSRSASSLRDKPSLTLLGWWWIEAICVLPIQVSSDHMWLKVQEEAFWLHANLCYALKIRWLIIRDGAQSTRWGTETVVCMMRPCFYLFNLNSSVWILTKYEDIWRRTL